MLMSCYFSFNDNKTSTQQTIESKAPPPMYRLVGPKTACGGAPPQTV